MITISQTFMRPSLDIAWYQDSLPASHKEYFKTNYLDQGKMVATREELSDGLILSVSFSFTDTDAYQEFMADPYFLEKASGRDQYNIENGIVRIE